MNTAERIEHLPGERRIVYISAVLGIVLFIAWFIGKRKAAGAPVSASQGSDGGPTGLQAPYDPNAALEASKAVSLASIAHSAALQFAIVSNSVSHDLGMHSSSGSGSGGLSIGSFSIGGGGSKSGSDRFDLTTSNDFSGSFGGANLSEDEFTLLVQEGQALANAAAMAQAATNSAGADKLNRYHAQPGPSNAPRGRHLEVGPNGQTYWVANGSTLHG